MIVNHLETAVSWNLGKWRWSSSNISGSVIKMPLTINASVVRIVQQEIF